ncbi:hypothetical protein CBOM_07585 [Ceraceosorus bombacis]|uniref:Uncharacterized protein n=1 Tax=Ceraceosorus bombacis TaxID=401625 RepID=A0A0P1BH28_9BASI|nr:hypothetical protein CBOM_07585 [Ceraceosorus bombacis]
MTGPAGLSNFILGRSSISRLSTLVTQQTQSRNKSIIILIHDWRQRQLIRHAAEMAQIGPPAGV